MSCESITLNVFIKKTNVVSNATQIQFPILHVLKGKNLDEYYHGSIPISLSYNLYLLGRRVRQTSNKKGGKLHAFSSSQVTHIPVMEFVSGTILKSNMMFLKELIKLIFLLKISSLTDLAPLI
jgi:hypothetical protein